MLRRPLEPKQYTSIRYTQRLEDIGAVRSVGSKGDSYDNAAAEAVNSLYKKELINREGPWHDAGDVTGGPYPECRDAAARSLLRGLKCSPAINEQRSSRERTESAFEFCF